jgi:hypothetical protein
MYYTLFAKGTAVVVIHFPKTSLKKGKYNKCMLLLVYQKSSSTYNYGNHSIPVILTQKGQGLGDIYFVN